jgi:hypothetical protein
MTGHIFSFDGDIQDVVCDAWLLPVDEIFNFTASWNRTTWDLPEENFDFEPWGPDEYARDWVHHAGTSIWLGKVGGWGLDATHYAHCVLEFLRGASQQWKLNNNDQTRLPRLAINHVGCGAGGAYLRHGEILKEIINSVTEELNSQRLQADVLLVSWGAKPHEATQRIRMHRHQDWKDDPQWDFGARTNYLHSEAELLAGKISGDLVSVFIGAGVSLGAGLSGWKDVLTSIGMNNRVLGHSQELDPLLDMRDWAGLLERRIRNSGSGETLQSLLSRVLHGVKYSLQHGLLSSLSCKEFITTNVDELFEKACRTNGRRIDLVPLRSNETSRWLLKIHGTVSDPGSLVFTRDHYSNSSRNNRALLGLVQAMLLTRHMLFIGYSLSDEDFHEVVFEVRSAFAFEPSIEKFGTVLTLIEDELNSELWSEDLRIVSMGNRNSSLTEAARDLERFMDLVGMLSSDRAAFILDDNYAAMRSESEVGASEALKPLLRIAQGMPEDGGWSEIKDLLRKLGGEV